MSRTLSVSYEEKPCYEIHIEQDFQLLLPLIQGLGYSAERKVCIVSDSTVAPLYLEQVQRELEQYFSLCTSCVFEAGEASKHTQTVGKVYEHLILHGFERKDLLVALGGGVVGDLTGFTAATYLRGIDFIQIPTTLLSQVDSSIGGKTGVDFLQYKNMVGAFYMPRLVYMNLSVLQTLTDAQYFSGMGEILKHGQIKDAGYFDWLLENTASIQKRDLDTLEEMIYRSCVIKRDVVERDPKEKGERALLNFGHTIGHAIEKLSDFGFLHGECVALGMVAAVTLSCKYGTYDSGEKDRLMEALEQFHLPTHLNAPAFSAEEVLQTTRLDKKMDGGKVKFILLRKPGEAYITRELSDQQLLDGIKTVF